MSSEEEREGDHRIDDRGFSLKGAIVLGLARRERGSEPTTLGYFSRHSTPSLSPYPSDTLLSRNNLQDCAAPVKHSASAKRETRSRVRFAFRRFCSFAKSRSCNLSPCAGAGADAGGSAPLTAHLIATDMTRARRITDAHADDTTTARRGQPRPAAGAVEVRDFARAKRVYTDIKISILLNSQFSRRHCIALPVHRPTSAWAVLTFFLLRILARYLFH